jgi:6-phosphogluconolactonase
MKGIILFAIVLFISVSAYGQHKNLQKFYVGTNTSQGGEGIYLCAFNSETGEIGLEKIFKAIDDPSFLKLSPDKKYLYVVTRATPSIETSGGFINAYQVVTEGGLKFLNKQISNGNDPCHVDVSADGKFVAIATYGGGTTSLYGVEKNGDLKPAASVIVNEGSSVNKSRQSEPHAHSIKFSPYDNQVFSADLGTDQLNVYYLENGEMVSSGQNFVKMPAGAGPRHFEFNPNREEAYVINELNSTISIIKRENNEWKVVQNITTVPENFEGQNYCADIHISSDGKYLYGSNRGHNSIAVYNVNEKTLTNIGYVSVEGNWPRNFGLTPDGKWMLVANQKSGDICVFKINPDTGIPEFTGKKIDVPAAVCIEFL